MAELLDAKKLKHTGYALSKASKGAINQTTADRLIKGPKRVDLSTLDVLCEIFDCQPADLWEERKVG